jgi:hypothetical protein
MESWNPARGATVGLAGMAGNQPQPNTSGPNITGAKDRNITGVKNRGLVPGCVRRDQAGKVILNRYQSIQVILRSASVSPAKR